MPRSKSEVIGTKIVAKSGEKEAIGAERVLRRTIQRESGQFHEKVLKTVDQSIECGSVLKSEVLRWTNKSFGSISRKKFKNWGRFHGKSRKFNCFNVSYVLRIGDNSLENCKNSKFSNILEEIGIVQRTSEKEKCPFVK